MDKDSSLFKKMKISYDDFATLDPHGKMKQFETTHADV